jgi:hypothetical protein
MAIVDVPFGVFGCALLPEVVQELLHQHGG